MDMDMDMDMDLNLNVDLDLDLANTAVRGNANFSNIGLTRKLARGTEIKQGTRVSNITQLI